MTGGAARAAISWASSPRHRRRSRADICDQACGRPSLSVEIHVRRAAARRLSSRRAASQRRGSGDHTPGRKCMCDCAGGAVLKKIAARFSFRGLRARKDTIAHATESHGVIRASVAVARRTGTQRACSVRAVRERVTSLDFFEERVHIAAAAAPLQESRRHRPTSAKVDDHARRDLTVSEQQRRPATATTAFRAFTLAI